MAMRVFRHLLVLLALATATFGDGSEKSKIEAVITQQLTAFLNRDAEAAWVHAHPTIKAQFRTPELFIRMVEHGYSPLLDFTELNFVSLEKKESLWLQLLVLRDSTNQLYRLYYSLVETQPDTFQINGVFIEPIESGI